MSPRWHPSAASLLPVSVAWARYAIIAMSLAYSAISLLESPALGYLRCIIWNIAIVKALLFVAFSRLKGGNFVAYFNYFLDMMFPTIRGF